MPQQQPVISDPSSGETIRVSTSTSSAMVSVPALKVPKLRSSCDECGTAKVKCSRSRPECSRCLSLGLNCIYGPSRKSGKPPRKRPCAEIAKVAQKRVCASRGSEDGHVSHTTAPTLWREHNSAEPAQEGGSVVAADVDLNLDFDVPSQFTPAFYPSIPLGDEWLQLGDWDTGPDIPPAPALNPLSTVSHNPSSQDSHSCARESYEIFRDLICPTPSLHAPESNSATVSAQLDQVLYFNRNAIDRLRRVLKCSCSKSGHRAMVHASILSRILIWYQQAAGWADNVRLVASNSSTSSSPEAGSDEIAAGAGTTSSPSLGQTTGFTVVHVPVSVGSFSIGDRTVQAALRNQLVLSELKMIAELINTFSKQDSAGPLGTGVAGLYSHLGTWLRSEHSRTIGILRSRLKALTEIL